MYLVASPIGVNWVKNSGLMVVVGWQVSSLTSLFYVIQRVQCPLLYLGTHLSATDLIN